MPLLRKFTLRSTSPNFTPESMDEIIRKIEASKIIDGDVSKFFSIECKEEGLAFAHSLKQQIIENGCTVPDKISAKHTNWLSSTELMESTYSLVLSYFNLNGTYDIITEKIIITGCSRVKKSNYLQNRF